MAILHLTKRLTFDYPQGIRPVCIPDRNTILNLTRFTGVSKIKVPVDDDRPDWDSPNVEEVVDYTSNSIIPTDPITYAPTYPAPECLSMFKEGYNTDNLICSSYNANYSAVRQ